MTLETLDPKIVMSKRPFVVGMSTALDIYGRRGLKVHEQIQQEWEELLSEQMPSAEESIKESIAVVNCEYQQFLAENKE